MYSIELFNIGALTYILIQQSHITSSQFILTKISYTANNFDHNTTCRITPNTIITKAQTESNASVGIPHKESIFYPYKVGK